MIRVGKWIVKHRLLILIVTFLTMIPCALGYIHTRVNYDILSYLPKDIDTMTGQDILKEDFGKGGFSLVMAQGMTSAQTAEMAEAFGEVEHVADVVCYDSMVGLTVPKEILPADIYDFFNQEDSTLMVVFFDDTTSADGTLDAVAALRRIAGKQCLISGMSAVTLDMKNLCESEVPVYAALGVLFTSVVLLLTTESFLLPVFFMLSIGVALLWNLGTNFFFGEISFVTNALAMVLQLGVTMDYSIFLWHSYQEQKRRFPEDRPRAMAHAIAATISSVTSSSITTIAGFLAMCFMTFTLGLDLGIVMSKGVAFGVISCVTVLPAMLLFFDRAIERTKHRELIPDLSRIGSGIVKHFPVFLAAALVLLVPSVYGYTHYDVYYNLDSTLPAELASVTANAKLSEEYDMNSTHMLLVDADMPAKTARQMLRELDAVDGVNFTLGFNSLVGPAIPEEVIPDSLRSTLKSENWQLMLIGSDYKVATDEVGAQVEEISSIVHRYDPQSLLIGEAPATKDLIDITAHDFKVVSVVSIAVIFLIIAVTFRSISLPFILVSVIELAIISNMGIAYFTHTKLPFIASVVIGTIQLGATVDYAILMTTRYKRERSQGKQKREAVTIALQTSMKSVIVSALGFFAATIGIGVYSDIGMISELCILLSRGALISMLVVNTVLPAAFMLADRVICATSAGFLPEGARRQRRHRFIHA